MPLSRGLPIGVPPNMPHSVRVSARGSAALRAVTFELRREGEATAIGSRREDAGGGVGGCGRRPTGCCAPGFGVRVLDREWHQRNRQPRRQAVRTSSGLWGDGGLGHRRVRPPLRQRSPSCSDDFGGSLAVLADSAWRTLMPQRGHANSLRQRDQVWPFHQRRRTSPSGSVRRSALSISRVPIASSRSQAISIAH
jgi:hypothetical protein